MKKMNKKGFTIVELVIVIAVIAILSAILVPTFGNVVKNAQEAADKADLKAAYTQALAEYTDAVAKGGTVATSYPVDDYTFTVSTDGSGNITWTVAPKTGTTLSEAAKTEAGALGITVPTT